MNGRTTVWDDPIEGYKNGREYLIPCLESDRPIDLVVMMLGTNDLKKRFSLSAFDIAAGAGVLVQIIRSSQAGPDATAPRTLLIVPPPLGKLTEFAEMFEDAQDKSKRVSLHYRRVAEQLGVELLDTSELIVSSDTDGIHLQLGEHEKLGKAVADLVSTMLTGPGGR